MATVDGELGIDDPEEKKSKTKKPKSAGTAVSTDPLAVVPLKTDKSKIKINKYMELGVIPKHPCSILMCGKSGAGKTQLLMNLLTRKDFYAGYFDLIFLFSETAKMGGDDLYDHLKELPKEHMFEPNEDGIAQLKHIIKQQKKVIKKKKITKAPKVLVLFDDIAHSRKFLGSREYLLLHIANRHLNISTFSLTQSYVKIPRSCRCQVSAVFFFHGGTNSEKTRLSVEHCPSNHSEKEFLEIVDYATAEQYEFLFINKFMPMKERYRKNLGTILQLSK